MGDPDESAASASSATRAVRDGSIERRHGDVNDPPGRQAGVRMVSQVASMVADGADNTWMRLDTDPGRPVPEWESERAMPWWNGG